MASTDDTETVDFYDLLAIPSTATESEIRRAYRKTSLLYHPDKVTPTPENLNKFQLLQTALNVLTDAAEKSKYDQTREAKQRRKAENEALESRRRKMKEDLEQRETNGTSTPASINGTSGTKRTWSDRELEIKRIAEENRKRREAATAKRTEETKAAAAAAAAAATITPEQDPTNTSQSTMDRSVKVRWIKEGDGLDIDDQSLTEMFPSGDIENIVILKDKKRRIEGRPKKVVLGTAVLVFKSLNAAKKIVTRGRTDELESVEWATSKAD